MSEPINKGIPPNPHPVKPPPNLPPPKVVASEPKRYDHFIKVYSKSFVDEVGTRYVYPDAGMTESVEGKYVEWEDYACLKAENDRLKEFAKILYHDSEVWIPREARIAIGIESPTSPKRPAGGSDEVGGMDGKTDQSKRL